MNDTVWMNERPSSLLRYDKRTLTKQNDSDNLFSVPYLINKAVNSFRVLLFLSYSHTVSDVSLMNEELIDNCRVFFIEGHFHPGRLRV